MKKIHEVVLSNPSDEDIIQFPISEAVVDENGNPKINRDTQQWVTTGETLVWTLMGGETKAFPKYVADYLMGIYAFLEPVDTRVQEVEVVDPVEEPSEKDEEKKIEGKQRCKFCGDEFVNVKGLGMHIAAKHPEALL